MLTALLNILASPGAGHRPQFIGMSADALLYIMQLSASQSDNTGYQLLLYNLPYV